MEIQLYESNTFFYNHYYIFIFFTLFLAYHFSKKISELNIRYNALIVKFENMKNESSIQNEMQHQDFIEKFSNINLLLMQNCKSSKSEMNTIKEFILNMNTCFNACNSSILLHNQIMEETNKKIIELHNKFNNYVEKQEYQENKKMLDKSLFDINNNSVENYKRLERNFCNLVNKPTFEDSLKKLELQFSYFLGKTEFELYKNKINKLQNTIDYVSYENSIKIFDETLMSLNVNINSNYEYILSKDIILNRQNNCNNCLSVKLNLGPHANPLIHVLHTYSHFNENFSCCFEMSSILTHGICYECPFTCRLSIIGTNPGLYQNIDMNYKLFLMKLVENKSLVNEWQEKFGGMYNNNGYLDIYYIRNLKNYQYYYSYKLIIIDNTCKIENYNMKPIRFYDKRPYFIYENKLHLLLLPMQVKETNSETFHTALLCIEFPDKIN